MATQCDKCKEWVMKIYEIFTGDYWERQKPKYHCFDCLSEHQKGRLEKRMKWNHLQNLKEN